MPVYFFDLYLGTAQQDAIGTLLPDKKAAWDRAVDLASQIIDPAQKQLPSSDYWLAVRDEAGQQIFTFHICAHRAGFFE